MQSTSSFNLDKAAYKVEKVQHGIYIHAPVSGGKLVGRKRKDGSYRRQCGEYVNDVVGIPGYVGNTLASKKARIKKGASPRPGSIGVLDTGTEWGHVLVFERILGADRCTISESNPFDTETFRRIDTTIQELKRRGYIGCTEGLDMTEKKIVSKWAFDAVEFSKTKGVLHWDDPQEAVNSETLSHTLFKLGYISEQFFTEDGRAYTPKEQLVTALYNKIK